MWQCERSVRRQTLSLLHYSTSASTHLHPPPHQTSQCTSHPCSPPSWPSPSSVLSPSPPPPPPPVILDPPRSNNQHPLTTIYHSLRSSPPIRPARHHLQRRLRRQRRLPLRHRRQRRRRCGRNCRPHGRLWCPWRLPRLGQRQTLGRRRPLGRCRLRRRRLRQRRHDHLHHRQSCRADNVVAIGLGLCMVTDGMGVWGISEWEPGLNPASVWRFYLIENNPCIRTCCNSSGG